MEAPATSFSYKKLEAVIKADIQLTNLANSLVSKFTIEQIKDEMRPKIQALFNDIEMLDAPQRYTVKEYDQLIDIISKWHRYFSIMGETINLPVLPKSDAFSPASLARHITRDTFVGSVVKISGQKTIKVEIQKRQKQKKYKKYVTQNKYLLVHDEQQRAKVGDKVIIASCRPISKTKHHRLFKIIHSAPENNAWLEADIE